MSGLPLPLATSASSALARGEALCASTNRARSFIRGDAVPLRICSTIGMPRSGSLFTTLLSAMSFSSSSEVCSGRTGCPVACCTSIRSAFASADHRLDGNFFTRSSMTASASVRLPSLLSAYAFQYIAPSAFCPFRAITLSKASTARSYRPESRYEVPRSYSAVSEDASVQPWALAAETTACGFPSSNSSPTSPNSASKFAALSSSTMASASTSFRRARFSRAGRSWSSFRLRSGAMTGAAGRAGATGGAGGRGGVGRVCAPARAATSPNVTARVVHRHIIVSSFLTITRGSRRWRARGFLPRARARRTRGL